MSADDLGDGQVGFALDVDLQPCLQAAGRQVRGWLQLLRGNVFSWTWQLDDATRNRAADAVRAWAAERYGDLSEARHVRHTIGWRAYDLP